MKVLVVGAGLSGLVAATEIQAAGHEVIVLEARDRVGGRVFTIREGFADGQFADIGAEIIYHGQNNIVELCAKHGVELSDEFSLGTDVPDLIFSGERLDRAAAAEIVNELRVAIKKTKPSHYESVAQWLRRARVSEPAELLLAAIAQSTPAAPLRTADAQELNVELSWGEAYRKIKGGNDTLPRTMARKVDARLQRPVRVVGWGATGVTVESDHETFHGDRVVVTVPGPLSRVHRCPPGWARAGAGIARTRRLATTLRPSPAGMVTAPNTPPSCRTIRSPSTSWAGNPHSAR